MTSAPPLPLFGIVLPSRPVQTIPLAISPTQFAFTFPSLPPFSHIVVFLLPNIALPPATLAGVYVQLPTTASSAEFQLLGALSNDKPSAIFRIAAPAHAREAGHTVATNGVGETIVGTVQEDEMVDVDDPSTTSPSAMIGSNGLLGEVTVGISIEPSDTLSAQLAALGASPSSSLAVVLSSSTARYPSSSQNPVPTKVLAQRIIKNAFNFLASFAGTAPGGEEVVPLRSFREWWVKFERRVENEPGFLERDGDG